MDNHTAAQETAPVAAVRDEPLQLVLTYSGLIEILADVEARPQAAADLPSLEHDQLATVLHHFPQAFVDALAEYDTTQPVVLHFLTDRTASRLERGQLVGYAIIGALSDFVRPLLLKDVQERWDRNHQIDAIEAPLSHYPALTDDQVVAQELGLGRSLS
jgi:hypothetical protein